jgi:cytochrome c peroxidase
MRALAFLSALLLLAGVALVVWDYHGGTPADLRWSSEELARLRSLSLTALPPLPADPSNHVADDPRAATFGQQLFFDARLSATGKVSCASCHLQAQGFTDGLATSRGIASTRRNAMTLIGASYASFYFWDGRKDSQWAQALAPLEDPAEHGGARTDLLRVVAAHYSAAYTTLFGPLPAVDDLARFPARASPNGDAEARARWQAMQPGDRVAVAQSFANLGKAIAAYERTLLPEATAFDRYVAALLAGQAPQGTAQLSYAAQQGARLFIGAANCTQCHSGPLLTNFEFHATGAGVPPKQGDEGRGAALSRVHGDEFNCLSAYSDANDPARDCGALRFLSADWLGLSDAFKVPTLRNLVATTPYMHDGSHAALTSVLKHYNQLLGVPRERSELLPLNLSELELRQIEAFLNTLNEPQFMPGN